MIALSRVYFIVLLLSLFERVFIPVAGERRCPQGSERGLHSQLTAVLLSISSEATFDGIWNSFMVIDSSLCDIALMLRSDVMA